MKFKPLPSQSYLQELFDYYPTTGQLIWKQRPRVHFRSYKGFAVWNANFAGKTAGYLRKDKQVTTTIDRGDYLVSRIIWKMVTGDDPADQIDHEDRDCSNNKWNNLREATNGQNGHNKGVRRDSKTGFKGVEKNGNHFVAYINIDGKKKYLGIYETVEEAYEVYCYVAKEQHGQFFNPG